MNAPSPAAARKPLIIAPDQGGHYGMGRMSAVFKAHGAETQSGYFKSEGWREPNTRGPGTHAHSDEHVFYVIEGTVAVELDGQWREAPRGSYLVIPGGTPHDFENRGALRAGSISINVPGGFENMMPRLLQHFAENPVEAIPP
jgi:mannose-6-phosphate isomerase-like protein (cupin superfamily)